MNHHKHKHVLFVLKQQHDYDEVYGSKNLPSGMYNSAKFLSSMLDDAGIPSHVVIVNNNNEIDKEVTKYKSTHVFIEGIWVVPEKFDVLKLRHPNVKWIVRCHSEIPFLAQEGNAIDWIFEYLDRDVSVAGNSSRINSTIRSLVGEDEMIPLLPNYYFIDEDYEIHAREAHKSFDIACFGAIRPLKNLLTQAIAAVEFAKSHEKHLNFHINIGRVEHNSNNQLKNVRSLFAHLGENYKLIEHEWLSQKDFKKLLSKIDISLQVSFSETFNLVSADAASVGTPIVVSPEITWAPEETWSSPTSIDSIVDTMNYVWKHREPIVDETIESLKTYSMRAKHLWIRYLNHY